MCSACAQAVAPSGNSRTAVTRGPRPSGFSLYSSRTRACQMGQCPPDISSVTVDHAGLFELPVPNGETDCLFRPTVTAYARPCSRAGFPALPSTTAELVVINLIAQLPTTSSCLPRPCQYPKTSTSGRTTRTKTTSNSRAHSNFPIETPKIIPHNLSGRSPSNC
jgi:hypothetical protein